MTREKDLPSILTRTELEWLLGKRQVSKSFEYKMKSEIRRKLQTFATLEYPLLVERGFDLTISSKNLTISSKVEEAALVAQLGQGEGRVNHETTIQKASPRWDSDPRPRVYETLALPG
jgi:hypothetical protein